MPGGTNSREGSGPIRFNGWLDRVQKEAQESEMDHTNTSPAFFWLLALIQLPLVQILSHLLQLPWLTAGNQAAWGLPAQILGYDYDKVAWMAIAFHIAGFFISVIFGTDMLFDLTGEITFTTVILYSYSTIEGPSTFRQKVVTAASLMWCIRLGYFLFARIVIRGHDWRFDKLIKGVGYNFFGWVCQGSWIWLNGFCLWALNSSKTLDDKLYWTDYAGMFVFIAALTFESISDNQKYAFTSQVKHDNHKKWITTGFWRYSRHPNYFGEMCVWVGLALMCVGGLECDFNAPGYDAYRWLAIAVVSPVWSWFFLVFTSLMLLEKRLDRRFGHLEAYNTYKQRTSVLIPWTLGPVPQKEL